MPISPHPHIFCCVCPACISKRIHTHPHIIKFLIFSHFGIVWKNTTVVTLPKADVSALLATASKSAHTHIFLPCMPRSNQKKCTPSIDNIVIIPHIQNTVKQQNRDRNYPISVCFLAPILSPDLHISAPREPEIICDLAAALIRAAVAPVEHVIIISNVLQ